MIVLNPIDSIFSLRLTQISPRHSVNAGKHNIFILVCFVYPDYRKSLLDSVLVMFVAKDYCMVIKSGAVSSVMLLQCFA